MFGKLIDFLIGYIVHNLLLRNIKLRKEIKRYTKLKYNPDNCLREFLQGIKDVPFYKELFLKNSVNVNSESIHEELQKLPILTREEIIINYDKIINKNFKGKTVLIGSSGTTATSLVFPCEKDRKNKVLAVWWRYRNNLGIKYGTWCGLFGGNVIIPIDKKTGPYYKIDLIGRQVLFSVFHLTINSVEEYYNEIRKRNLKWLHGHAHNITLLADLIQQKNLISLDSVKFITTGADSLFDYQRNIIRKSFPNAIIRQHYGLSEGVANISEDLNGKMKVDEDYAYVEFIPIDEKDNSLCRIIGTGFNNKAFPMLRYDTGDLATVRKKSDGELEIIQIDGRTVDCIKLPGGRRISSTSMTNFEFTTNVKEVQFYQTDVYNIVVRIVRRIGYDENEEQKVVNCVRERLPENVNIKIEYIEKVERTKSGKIRYIISDITE